ncbi:MAG: ROK family transcriptional regulator [Planctomycetota bacterium]|jgi:predicted NBD/HSP70 family sugar kinase|nr:ROK family transcriptional regulator [Planctomycetota bacterium]
MRRNQSLQQVLNLIRKKSPIGQAEISRALGISLPMVMQGVRRLRDYGWIREAGKGQSTGGKPPVLLEFASDAYYSVGVELDPERILVVLMDGKGELSRQEAACLFTRGPVPTLERLRRLITQVLNKVSFDPGKLLGIGVAAPGWFDPVSQRLIHAPLFGWRDVDFLTPLGQWFQTHVCVGNHIRATACGEKIFGAAREAHTYLCVHLGWGIGGALVLADRLYTGESGSAGELGHSLAVPGGPLCNCGKRGCLEAVASEQAILRDAREKLADGQPSSLGKPGGGTVGELSLRKILTAAAQGDPLAKDLLENAQDRLGAAIADAINLLDPELVILDGSLVRNRFFPVGLRQAIDRHRLPLAGTKTRITLSQLGADAPAIGAAAMVMKQVLEEDFQGWQSGLSLEKQASQPASLARH